MKRVLLTGAEGFTGRYLAPLLQQAGHEVHGLVRASQAEPVRGLTSEHVCDLGDASGMCDLIRRVRPHQVAHLAGIAFVAHGDASAIYQTNIVGTRNLLEALAGEGASGIESVLLASSANVYGDSTEGVLDESSAVSPANDYAVSKLAMEHMAHLYRDRLPIVITRPFNYTGVGQSESFLLPKIVAHIRRGAPVIELGNLDVARDFSDVRMVVEAYARLMQTPAAVGQTFNVCSGKAYSLNEVLNLARDVSRADFQVRVNPAFVRQNEVKMLLGSRARLDNCVGALHSVDLRDTLRWMIEAPPSPG
ncbi:GDP-mannose 4,6-dehydratase [Sphaerotilaceae bacterium SBD11-9]